MTLKKLGVLHGDGAVLLVIILSEGSTVWHASIAPSFHGHAPLKLATVPSFDGSNIVLNTPIQGITPVISIKTGDVYL